MLEKQEKQEKQEPQLENTEILEIEKEKEIEKLKRENAMLTINNQQLQYELIRTIKQLQ